MKNSEAKIAANNRWVRANYDRLSVAIPKGKKDIIRKFASRNGESINSFVSRAIEKEIDMSEALKYREFDKDAKDLLWKAIIKSVVKE